MSSWQCNVLICISVTALSRGTALWLRAHILGSGQPQVEPWTIYSAFLSLTFLISKMGITGPYSYIYSEDKIRCGLPRRLSGKDCLQCRRWQETRVRSVDWKDALEKEVATHSSTVAWRIPWTEGPRQTRVHRVTKIRTWLSNYTTKIRCTHNQNLINVQYYCQRSRISFSFLLRAPPVHRLHPLQSASGSPCSRRGLCG